MGQSEDRSEQLERMTAQAEQVMATEIVDIDDEADRLLTMVRVEREALAREIADARGWPPRVLGEQQLKKLAQISKIFNEVTQAVNRLDATRERRAKKLKRGDFIEAATKLIQGLPYKDRGYWLKNMIRFHRRAIGRLPSTESMTTHLAAAEARIDTGQAHDD